MMKATKDLSRAQFDAALKAHGLRKVFFWIEDATGECSGVSWGMVVNGRTGKLMRRTSLAKAIRERNAEIAKRRDLPCTC